MLFEESKEEEECSGTASSPSAVCSYLEYYSQIFLLQEKSNIKWENIDETMFFY